MSRKNKSLIKRLDKEIRRLSAEVVALRDALLSYSPLTAGLAAKKDEAPARDSAPQPTPDKPDTASKPAASESAASKPAASKPAASKPAAAAPAAITAAPVKPAIAKASPAKELTGKAEQAEATPAKAEPTKAGKVKAEPAKPAAKRSAATPGKSSKTVAELRADAKAAGIKGYSSMKKAELIAALG